MTLAPPGAPADIYEPAAEGALRQGELISDFVQLIPTVASLATDTPILSQKVHPFAAIITQDCDLDWDFKARRDKAASDKLIPNVLFCEVIEAEELRGREDINSMIWSRIKLNKDERYQFLQRVEAKYDAKGRGLPEMGLDFKRYFSVPTEEVYFRLIAGASRRCRLKSPYLEHLSVRFSFYQSRIALPSEHFSEPAEKK